MFGRIMSLLGLVKSKPIRHSKSLFGFKRWSWVIVFWKKNDWEKNNVTMLDHLNKAE